MKEKYLLAAERRKVKIALAAERRKVKIAKKLEQHIEVKDVEVVKITEVKAKPVKLVKGDSHHIWCSTSEGTNKTCSMCKELYKKYPYKGMTKEEMEVAYPMGNFIVKGK